MHYPIGTDICVTNQRPRPAGGIRSITDARTAGFTNKTPFVTNAKYSLYNIRIMENKVLYEFIMIGGQSIDDNIFLEFDSTVQADQLIASAKGDELPDYDAFHKRKSA
tara:strand:- start:80 stop:403 length:324 start_codon:yes stop_codon:yes gene_type:complete